MSTKIYDAYRIPKSEFPNKFIAEILKELKEDSIEYIRTSEEDLEAIHLLATVWAMNNKDEDVFQEYIESEKLFDKMLIIRDYLDECEKQTQKDLRYYDIDFNCSVFEDEDYWYLKCYPNQRWQWNLLNQWEEFDWFEDYHYQNQTDPPEDIPYEEYKKRDEKWEELTLDANHYRHGLQYVFFDSQDFWHLMWNHDREDKPSLVYEFDGLKKTEDGKIAKVEEYKEEE